MKRERLFRFKHFSVSHSKSAMKVGVDGVLVGAWADVTDAKRILDVGCGCGLIALMMAQRNEKAKILAIDVDPPSVDEARDNILLSPWAERITAKCEDFSQLHGMIFDMIISNPPFFNSGVNSESSARMKARHIGALSPESLIRRGAGILSKKGKISQIFPKEMLDEVLTATKESGLHVHRITDIIGRKGILSKRVLYEAGREEKEIYRSFLILEVERGVPTEEYRELTQNFYLKF